MRGAGFDGAGSTVRVSGFAASGEITPSDSVTGFVALGATGAKSGDDCETAAGAAFCRTARYEPPAAAARHPTNNPAKTSLLNSIAIELLGLSVVGGLPLLEQVPCRVFHQKTPNFTPVFDFCRAAYVLILGRCPLQADQF